MKLAFSLESWSACGGNDMEMTGEEAIREGNEHIDQALCIFKEVFIIIGSHIWVRSFVPSANILSLYFVLL